MTDLQTAVQASQPDRQRRFAMERLLHALRPFMRAYPRDQDAQMPEHAMVWMTDIDDGP